MYASSNNDQSINLARWAENAVADLRAVQAANHLESSHIIDEMITERTRELVARVPQGHRSDALRTLKARLRPTTDSGPSRISKQESIESCIDALKASVDLLSLEQAANIVDFLRDSFPDLEPQVLKPDGAALTADRSTAELIESILGNDSIKGKVTEERARKLVSTAMARLIKLDTVFAQVFRELHQLAKVTPPTKDSLSDKLRAYAVSDTETPFGVLESRLVYTERHLAALILAVSESWKKSHLAFENKLSPATIEQGIETMFGKDAKCWIEYKKRFSSFNEDSQTAEFLKNLIRNAEEWTKK